jgi:hypothetical protein
VSRCGEAYQVVGSDPACRLLGNRRFAGYRLVDQQFDDRRWCRQPDDYHVGECECENYANTKILCMFALGAAIFMAASMSCGSEWAAQGVGGALLIPAALRSLVQPSATFARDRCRARAHWGKLIA